MSKSFIDVLFILLLGTMVMLTQSVQLGAVDTSVTRLGAGGISPVRADAIEVVVVDDQGLTLDDGTPTDVESLTTSLEPAGVVLLITADGEVRHHRMMDVWSDLRERNLDVKLGALPRTDEPEREP